MLKINGKVIEVIDGKNVVIETVTNNKINAELDFIEIPEPEQQLSQTVKEHLEKLVLGKNVTFLARIILKTKFIGKLSLDNVDVSQQLLRDGAAWYAILDKDSQNDKESESYQLTETQAKLEKRGVWGIENLKPAWEFRAEREKANEQSIDQLASLTMADAFLNKAGGSKSKPAKRASMQPTMWADISGINERKYLGIEGLFVATLPDKRVTVIYTGSSFPNVKQGKLDKIEFRTLYGYRGNQTSIEKDIYVICFLTDSKSYQFARSNSLTISTNGAKFALGKAFRFYRPTPTGVQELLLYRIPRSSLAKLTKASNVTAKIGNSSVSINQDSKTLIEKLMNVSN